MLGSLVQATTWLAFQAGFWKKTTRLGSGLLQQPFAAAKQKERGVVAMQTCMNTMRCIQTRANRNPPHGTVSVCVESTHNETFLDLYK